MKKQDMMPDLSVDRRLLDNLRQARLSFEEVDLQMEEIIAKLDELIRQQKLQHIKQKQKTS
ncbi:hypothetical protein [Chamaesiphon sp. OTE_75_metabat_556]|uniref:hypothetical protein n=1 Tax=Chamaesiphon sp. OTE_75_metabat_556 TaxID=2964692 RepID=UPI00286C1219|nr:hypothetical protein [Chamaesiphon sp. OTE_75_metabat_556]